jgi:hypothetical protein
LSPALPSSVGMSFGDLTSPSASTSGWSPTPASSTFSPTSQHIDQRNSPGDLAYLQPLGPIHTPLDLVIVVSLPAPSPGASLPLKVKLMRSSLAFVLATMGPKDRISLVTCEVGHDGVTRKTPFLNTTRYESRRRLEAFVEGIGDGSTENDEFETKPGNDEKQDVVTAVNIGTCLCRLLLSAIADEYSIGCGTTEENKEPIIGYDLD